MAPSAAVAPPSDVRDVLETLWRSGHAAYLVGGGVRDTLLERGVTDWDIATDARPERTCELFPTGRYENRFGTVTVPTDRTERRGDHLPARPPVRRPSAPRLGNVLERDRRGPGAARLHRQCHRLGHAPGEELPQLVDPIGGLADLARSLLRAVGDPAVRFDEDALRLLRAARLAAQLHFEIEPATLAAMASSAGLVRWVSQERIGAELRRMVATDPPSNAFEILSNSGLLEHALPELAAQRGVPQDKQPGHDLWDHCLATVDAAAAIDSGNALLRVAALLHDIGKPKTFADGHFIGHDLEGARLAEAMLTRLAFPRREVERVRRLIAEHMFSYERRWTSAAVRRFIRRIGRDLVDDLLELREADNLGSGLPADAGYVEELRRRVRDELAAHPPLSLRDLAVNGGDLIGELGMQPGPPVGELLERLLGSVIADPSRNHRERLLADARDYLGHDE